MTDVKGNLYLVSTPIGNLEDMTLRGLRTLRDVDLIAAEDTRQSRKLLNHFAIQKPLTSYFQHNEKSKGRKLIEMLLDGKNIAVISDAGTPAISDPGSDLVCLAIDAGVRVIPIPGASAVLSVLSAGGLDTSRFAFEGFVPREKSRRRKHLQSLAQEERTMVFYEAPHRLRAFLADVEDILGERQVVIGREMTKRFEEIKRGTIGEIREYFTEREPRGEFAIAIDGCPLQVLEVPDDKFLIEEVVCLMQEGKSRKASAKQVAQKYQLSVKTVYDMTL